MGEFELIREIFYRGPSRKAALGMGDDCALLNTGKTLAVSSDMLVSGRHFLPNANAFDIGYKSLAVNLSDLAAMGASPLAFTLALALPKADETWLTEFARGLFTVADQYGCELIGGDTTKAHHQEALTISITVIGELSHSGLRRASAQPGDHLWVSGSLGGPAKALAVLMDDSDGAGEQTQYVASDFQDALTRLHRPQPRVELGLTLAHLARAAIDISDGLIGDVGHIAEQSRLRAEIDISKVPFAAILNAVDPVERLNLALAGGDDYELAFTADPSNRAAIDALSKKLEAEHGYGLTLIGRMLQGEGVALHDEDGRPVNFSAQAFEHF